MKKLFALVTVALIGIGSCFAFDIGTLSGSWVDSNWNAKYTIQADTNGNGVIVLTNSKTGNKIWTFNDSNTSEFQLGAGLDGVSISFYCKATMRHYKFTATLSKNLKLFIDPDWKQADYETEIKWVDGSGSANVE